MRSKPRKQEVASQQLRGKNIEVFFPKVRVHPVNPRSRKYKPYFPGYLFVKVDLDDVGISTLQYMPHTLGLVSFGGEPADVPEPMVLALKKRVDEINQAGGELFDELKTGDSVFIDSGPFEGYEAIFDGRLPGTERVRVLLQFLSDRKVPIELDASNIKQSKRK
jgi:transcriptional antiterminator RfaH